MIMIVYVLWKRIHNQLGIPILESRFPIRDYKFSNPESQDRKNASGSGIGMPTSTNLRRYVKHLSFRFTEYRDDSAVLFTCLTVV